MSQYLNLSLGTFCFRISLPPMFGNPVATGNGNFPETFPLPGLSETEIETGNSPWLAAQFNLLSPKIVCVYCVWTFKECITLWSWQNKIMQSLKNRSWNLLDKPCWWLTGKCAFTTRLCYSATICDKVISVFVNSRRSWRAIMRVNSCVFFQKKKKLSCKRSWW